MDHAMYINKKLIYYIKYTTSSAAEFHFPVELH